ncbi:MAG TPA: hypothetical protein VJX67_11715, partial [Blastocatellia bacterium]|nr:hypothetical protein [Blastocatellia bacterium]
VVGFFGPFVALFFLDERPSFIRLNVRNGNATDRAIHEAFAPLTGNHQEFQDSVAMNGGNPLDCAHRAAFQEKLNRHEAALCVQVIFNAERALVLFRECLLASHAAIALQPVPVFPEPLGFALASGASHN